MYHPYSQALFDHWLDLPREGVLPLRSSFLPEKVPELLPGIIIYEVISPIFIRFRLIGTAIRERMGVNATGQNYLDFVTPERRAKASQSFYAMVEQPCGMRVVNHHKMASGHKKLLEVILLPMKNDVGDNPVFLCQGNEIKPEKEAFFQEQDLVQNIGVMRRDFIDIGAGVSNFKD